MAHVQYLCNRRIFAFVTLSVVEVRQMLSLRKSIFDKASTSPRVGSLSLTSGTNAEHEPKYFYTINK
ncbi:MAG: hypothetical protein ABI210_08440 [Abditibacteriaceae bacterium]